MESNPWNHNIHYYDLVLSAAGPGCRCVLDVGCGQGLLARRLAQRCHEVIAIDIDREVISHARSCESSDARIRFVHGDVMTYPFPDASFDLIAAVATLHHLPLEPALVRFRSLLRPEGVLAVIGLFRGQGRPGDYALSAVAFPVSWMFRLFRGHAEVGAPVQDPKETLAEIRSACNDILPGASLRRQLLFRYFLTWRKPPV